MWFYLLFLLLIGICLDKYTKTQSTAAHAIVIILITSVAICRYNIGYDYETYHEIIKHERTELVEMLFSPLSALLAKIAIYFHSPQLLFILFGIPTYFLLISTIKKYSLNYSLSVLIFICLFYYTSLSVIRQALSVAICFYGYKFVVDRKFIKYLITIVIAALVHPSAIIALAIYWIVKFRFKILITLIICGILIKPVIFHLMEQYGFYSSYITEDKELSGGKLTSLLEFFFLAICLLLWKSKKMTDNNGLINILVTGMCMYFMFGAHIGGRAGLYFNIFFCLLIPNILFFLTGKFKMYTTYIISFIFISYFIAYLWMPILRNEASAYIPYKVFFLQ